MRFVWADINIWEVVFSGCFILRWNALVIYCFAQLNVWIVSCIFFSYALYQFWLLIMFYFWFVINCNVFSFNALFSLSCWFIHLISYIGVLRWDEGESWQGWVFSLCCYACSSRCFTTMQGILLFIQDYLSCCKKFPSC